MLMPGIMHTAHAEISIEFERDPFYSNVNYYTGLSTQSILVVTEDDEAQIYQRLLDSLVTNDK